MAVPYALQEESYPESESFPEEIMTPAIIAQDKFLFCCRVANLKEACCCNMCTLKTGVLTLSVLSMVFGGFAVFDLIFKKHYDIVTVLWRILRIVGIYFGYLGYIGASKSLPNKSRSFYYFLAYTLVVISPILIVLNMILGSDDTQLSREDRADEEEKLNEENEDEEPESSSPDSDRINITVLTIIIYLILWVLIEILVKIYFTLVVYSHYNQLLLGHNNLVNHGKQIAAIIAQNAANRDIRTVQLEPMTGVVVGHPLPQGAQVPLGIQ